MVPIMESVLGDAEPRGEAWECVNELEPGLALRGWAVPLCPLALRLARRWWEGGVDGLVLCALAVSSLWASTKFHLAQPGLGKMFSYSSQRAI